MSDLDKIWVLGGHSDKADRNIKWNENLPNLTNADILIINLNSLPTLSNVNQAQDIRKYVLTNMMASKDTYVILPEKDHPIIGQMFPTFPIIEEIKKCNINNNHTNISENLKNYVKYIKNCLFFIYDFDTDYFKDMIDPNSAEMIYDFTDNIRSISDIYEDTIYNYPNQVIGRSIYFFLETSPLLGGINTGKIIFLPPVTDIPISESVHIIVNSLVGSEIKEDPPTWVKTIDMPNIESINSEIQIRQNKINTLNTEIEEHQSTKTNIEKYLRLLWLDGPPLEDIVQEAFVILGFPDIKTGRAKGLEDWVIELQTSEEYELGVLEVKGAANSTSMKDLDQCNRWVTQYTFQEEKRVKGIFIPNQFRKIELPESDKRKNFASNQIQAAQQYKLCILPTIEIFKAVVKKLGGNPIGRYEIERRILNADPICKLVD